MSEIISDEIDWDAPEIQEAIKEASYIAWHSKLIYGYWFFLCASKVFIGAPKTIPMSKHVASVIDWYLCHSVPCYQNGATCLPE